MNIVSRCQLRQGLFPLDGRQCYFSFKGRRVIAAGSLRHGSPSFQAISSPVMSGVSTYPGVSKSGASSLLLDIKRLASYENSNEKFMGELFDEFNTNPDSVLAGWLSAAEKQKGKISRVTFNTAIRPALGRFSQKDVESVFPALNNYLIASRQHLADKKAENVLSDPTVFKALLDIFPRIARVVLDRKGQSYNHSDFFDAMEPMFRHTRRATFENPGTSYKALSERLLKKLDLEPLL